MKNLFIKNKRLFILALPLFVENFLFMLAGMADTLMLSNVADTAVAGVGAANAYLGVFAILFTVICGGLTAVMTQYIGAKKKGVAVQARKIAIILNSCIGIVFSLSLGIFGDHIVNLLGVAEGAKQDAIAYFRIVGGASIITAIIPVFASFLISFNKTKFSLASAAIGNAVNILLNLFFIFVLKQGVVGVAIATVIGRIVQLSLNILFSKILIKSREYTERINSRLLFTQIIKIGLPAALESVSYFVAIAIVTSFISQMGAEAELSTIVRSYALQITNFSNCVAMSLAQANIVMNGWRIGEGKIKECYDSSKFAATISIGADVFIEFILALSSTWFMQGLTKDPEVIRLVQMVLFIDIALEVGRSLNMVFAQSLKAAGDSYYPAVIAVIVNFGCAVLLSYLFGIVFKLGICGIYIGLALDEIVRGVFMFFRYKGGKWENKVIVKNTPPTEIVEQY